MNLTSLDDLQVCVIGLGYVGLPLAVAFSHHYKVTGFDINSQRIAELQDGRDTTLEVSTEELNKAGQLQFTNREEDIQAADFYIITVPTPIDDFKNPDLTPLQKASSLIGRVISPNNIVVYESTVFPGATEEVCIPIVESVSGLSFNQDFFAGYSPERINPGDKEHRVNTITKVTSGSTPEIGQYVDSVYRKVIDAGTHLASSIKVAEAAKVIENTQRDLNIALVNELALIFEKLGIDTEEVLQAAGTKWNFLPFRPGLVGGHCISVDPYYLTHKAQEIGYHPEIILAGRRINDGMGAYVAERVIKLMTRKKIHVVDSNVLILGLAFKENCPDLRNTRVIDVINELQHYHANISVYDPWVDKDEAEHEYGIRPIQEPQKNHYDAVILAVGHRQFQAMGASGIQRLAKPEHVIFDVKYCLEKDGVDGRL